METLHTANSPARKCWGTLVRKERWGLTWRGRLLLALLAVSLGAFLVRGVHPFLAPVQRVESPILVTEGWVREYAIRSAIEEYQGGSYDRIYVTGGPVSGLGGYVNDYQTTASVGAGRLKAAGAPVEAVQMVPSKVSGRDRTFNAAVALREWFRQHDIKVTSFNILTEDVHARRTRLLYQEAFGDGVEIGIIAVPNPDYDAKHWWRYSEGVRDVLGESIAYLYAKFVFHP